MDWIQHLNHVLYDGLNAPCQGESESLLSGNKELDSLVAQSDGSEHFKAAKGENCVLRCADRPECWWWTSFYRDLKPGLSVLIRNFLKSIFYFVILHNKNVEKIYDMQKSA